MPRSSILAVAAMALALMASTVAAGTPLRSGPNEEASDGSSESVQRLMLDNGARLVLSVNQTAPTVAICVSWAAGVSHEPVEHHGAATIAAHLLRSPANYAHGDTPRQVVARGVRLHSRADAAFTQFCVAAPATEASYGVWLIAERIHRLHRLADGIGRAVSAAVQVFRAESLDDMLVFADQRRRTLAFQGEWASARPALPLHGDIPSLPVAAVVEFAQSRLQVEQAVVSVSGAFRGSEILEQLVRRLGAASSQPAPPPTPALQAPALPRQTTQRFSSIVMGGAKTPALLRGWLFPREQNVELRALELAALVLGGSGASRLERELVDSQGIAQRVAVSIRQDRAAFMFAVDLVAAGRNSPEKLGEALDAAVMRLATRGPAPHELQRARQLLRTQLLEALQSNEQRALWLARRELAGRPLSVAEHLAQYDAVTAADVRRSVAQHVTPLRAATVEVYPPEWRQPTVVRLPKYHIVKSGETLTGIARQHRISLKALTVANQLNPRRPIQVGQKLRIVSRVPKERSHKVRKGDTLIGIAKRYGVTVQALRRLNGLRKGKPIYPDTRLRVPPRSATVPGRGD